MQLPLIKNSINTITTTSINWRAKRKNLSWLKWFFPASEIKTLKLKRKQFVGFYRLGKILFRSVKCASVHPKFLFVYKMTSRNFSASHLSQVTSTFSISLQVNFVRLARLKVRVKSLAWFTRTLKPKLLTKFFDKFYRNLRHFIIKLYEKTSDCSAGL